MAKAATKQQPKTTSQIILEVLKLTKGASSPGNDTPLRITEAQLSEIEKRLTNLNGATPEARQREILGTCRSMGIRLRDG